MSYLIWKLIHITSVIMFLGNIATGVFWAARAHKSHDFNYIASTFQNIIQSDRYFTVPGVIGIITAGIVAAINGNIPMLSTGWIFWPIILFSISGIIFSIYVGPLQRKIVSFALSAENNNDWESFEYLYKKWALWGLISLITPTIAMVIMVLKPNLPGL